MAEAIVEVTAGSGTKLHSWSKTVGANTVHDEFVLPGEYPLASYFLLANATSIATANDHILQIMAGASLNVRIRRILIEQNTNAGTAAGAFFEIWRLSTAGTGGTSVTARPLDTSDSAAGATGMTLPSSKGTESLQLIRGRIVMASAYATNGTQEDGWGWEQKPGQKPIIIAAGTSNGIAIKSTAGVASAAVNIIIEFVETSF